MKRSGRLRSVFCICAAMILCGCGAREPLAPPEAEQPAAAAPQTAPQPDGLQGGYYNDFLAETLTLDGFGGCCLADADGVRAGAYTSAEGGVLLSLPEGEVRAERTAEGDLCLDGRTGRYLCDWAFWGISAERANLHPTQEIPDAETFAVGGGALRHRDMHSGVAFSYAEALTLLPRGGGAAAVTDGQGGFVSVRNVTAEYAAAADGAFPESCVRTYAFGEFERLYGERVRAYEGLQVEAGTADPGSAELTVFGCGETAAQVRVKLCRAAYDDGTENVLLVCVFAPDAERTQALCAEIFDVCAVRVTENGE